MSKKKSETEIVINPVETALQAQFKEVSQDMIASAFFAVGDHQKAYLTKAIGFGMMAIAIKAQLKHGEFKPWVEAALEKYSKGKMLKRDHFEAGQSYPSVRRWMGLARKILKEIADPNENSIFGKKVLEYCKNNKLKVEDLPLLLSDTKKTIELIDELVAGFTMNSLADLFKGIHALTSAEEELELLENAKGGNKPAPKPADAQLQLWDDWTNEFERIDELLEGRSSMFLGHDQWLRIEQQLKLKLEKVQKITRSIKK